MPQYRVTMSTVVKADSREDAEFKVDSQLVPLVDFDVEVDSVETVNEIGKF